jgi:hypothetical protein
MPPSTVVFAVAFLGPLELGAIPSRYASMVNVDDNFILLFSIGVYLLNIVHINIVYISTSNTPPYHNSSIDMAG